ncbi:uncharacterized protein LOC117554583 isoform X2 [Gymnodraco acuticeps]|nr:uncharacterized protein LOC117554583 isoform X2 [Gymnodraco acuticeps]XP_034084912.1 uncharacterized protein LOC117554583 isoform X2 [Gymnodraco acuticeps]XP_034084913.1 uncharacterized protein LOC117554583 isoform X2 [Gymnodraco acuticeps]XP_034084914.1 uncharacterized protein LOC117554583 isoform X2 [Gymnodraco acuticeps]
MIGSSDVLVLTVGSVLSLSLLSVLCLRCKKKSKIIHEEHQIYDPRTFQRGGSRFAVTESKTVTRANQITSTTVGSGPYWSPPRTAHASYCFDKLKRETQEDFEDFSTAANDEQSDYQNVSDAQTGNPEHTYVAPLPMSAYINELMTKEIITDQNPAVYANVISSLQIKEDEDDYENSDFLDKIVEEEEDNEPDYVNENG